LKIILREDVRDLGRSGDLVEVKEGYARNFLLPRKLAVPATKGNLNDFQKRIAVAKEREERDRLAATTLGERLRGQRILIIHRAAEGGTRIHGSITPTEVAQAMSKLAGQEIDRRDVDIKHPIRALGEYQVNLKLMKGMSVPLRLLVADREPTEEAPAAAEETAAGEETPDEVAAVEEETAAAE
jgi:large subunit ribosomal protein L9